MSRIAIALMWLLHWLPFRAIGMAGALLGHLLYQVNSERRHTTLTNLRLCFPDLSSAEITALAQRHFVAFAQSALERGVLWWASPDRLHKLIATRGDEHLRALDGRRVILVAPHFVGLDAGWTRLTMEHDMATMYAHVKNIAFDNALRHGRERFGQQQLLSRQAGLRDAIAAIRNGNPFYYLPDMDYGAKDALFVSFFGIEAATITTLARLARITDARVATVVTRRHRDGYVVSISAPWENFPSDNLETDTKRMNSMIEAEVMAGDVAQYFWSHKRFKSRPPGEKGVY